MPRLFRAAIELLLAVAAFSLPSTALAQASGGDDLRPALLDVTLNEARQPEPVLFLQGTDGSLFVAADTLRSWRIVPPGSPDRIQEGQAYHRLDRLTGLASVLDEAAQSLVLSLPASAFAAQRAALREGLDMPMTPPATGAFVNYDLFVEHVAGTTQASGVFEAGLFTRRGVGQTSFIASVGAGRERLVRLDSSWTIDRPDNLTTLRIGDTISVAGPGAAPVRFAGVQYQRNFATRPGYVTMPLPAGIGEAAVPSVVDVYVNNVLQGSREVAPGPFELSGIPVEAGGGRVQLVVRDLLGRETVSDQAYYASTQALRRGLHDFSWEAGFVRKGFGRRSNDYGALMVSTTHRYGFSERVTGEAHLQASQARQMAGAAITFLAFDLGQIGVSASASHSGRGSGVRVAGAFERRSAGLSFGILGEYMSADFAVIGTPDDHRPPRYLVQAFADLPIGRGSVGANLLHRAPRDSPSETLIGLFGSLQIGNRLSAQLFARRSIAGPSRETAFGVNLSMALGRRRSASATIEHGRRGIGGIATVQDSPPIGVGAGWRLAAGIGEFERVEAAFTYNLPMTTLGAQVAHAGGSTGIRVSAAGALGWVGGRAFASRSLGESFAAIVVDGGAGLRVYRDDQLVGTTDAGGALMVPGLRPFEPNRLRIDETDLPLDVRIDATEIMVRPFARSGTIVRFALRSERGVLMRVQREDGSALPAGAAVRLEGEAESHVVVAGGEVYVPGLIGTRRLHAMWDGGRCSFSASLPAGDDPQPLIDGLVCRGDSGHAETGSRRTAAPGF